MQAKNLCKSQFQLNKFGVGNVSMEKFYTFQWWNCRLAFVIYRAVILTWTIGWMIYFWTRMSVRDNYTHLTNWVELYIFIYYIFAFVVSVYGAVTRNQTNPSKAGIIRILQGATWIFQSISFGCSLCVFIVYWTLLAPNEKHQQKNLQSARNLYIHGFITATLLLDIFLAAIPVRLLHVFYTFLGFVVYAVFLIIWQLTTSTAIYIITDFDENLPMAIGLVVGLTVIGPLISQTLLFFLYWLKTLCMKNDTGSSSSSSDEAEEDKNVTENTFAMELDINEEEVTKSSRQFELHATNKQIWSTAIDITRL